jgi:hypothetical protein
VKDPQGPPALFLERRSFRRRRLGDAAALLPVAGALLFALPLIGFGSGEEGAGALRAAGLYVFAVWFLLILCAAVLSRALAGDAEHDE